jgi:exopolyphosphatase/guanosine-5'-triphosphate,3'-diphosphate pyrophosphatase
VRERITRLGEGVDSRRKLLPLPIARVRNVLTDYRRELESLGAERVLAVATSAVRDAENGEAFLGEVEWSYGFTTQLLTGEEEAALILRGVGDISADTLVLDVGGGSTELVMRDRALSLDVGSVRLTEQFGEDVDAIAAHVRSLLPADLAPAHAVGVAGTITSLAALDLALPAARRAAQAARTRSRARARDRRGRRDRARGTASLRPRRARGERARPAPRRGARRSRAA